MGLAGLLFGGSRARRLDVFIDYQNVHLTGHRTWCSQGAALHDCLLDPLQVSLALAAMFDDAVLGCCFVYRGRPDPRKQPKLAAFNDRQAVAAAPTRSNLRGQRLCLVYKHVILLLSAHRDMEVGRYGHLVRRKIDSHVDAVPLLHESSQLG